MKKLFIISCQLFCLTNIQGTETANKTCNSCQQCQTCSYNKPVPQSQNESLQENLEEQVEQNNSNKEMIQNLIQTMASVAQSIININPDNPQTVVTSITAIATNFATFIVNALKAKNIDSDLDIEGLLNSPEFKKACTQLLVTKALTKANEKS